MHHTVPLSRPIKSLRFSRNLENQGDESDAKEILIEFLDRDEQDLLINRGDQRIVFVANNYRKEVTSTVLWLLKHDIQVQCFRALPFSMGEETFLQMEQIIPLPETKEFMIDAKEKEKEEKEISKTVAESEARLLKFWGLLKKDLSENNVDFLDRVSANTYYSIGFWKGRGKFSFCIGKSTFRVELYFLKDPDKKLIDSMAKYKEEIKSKYTGEIIWERLEKKKASRIKAEVSRSDISELEGRFSDEVYWDELIT